MLEVSQLTRCYGDFVAVDTVGFSIGQGEIVGLLGHNGAGKTTIMKMLSGYLEPNAGEIRIDDVDLALNTKLVQRNLGYLPENLPVYQEMCVADYLDYAAELKGLQGDSKYAEIKRAVRATEIGPKLLSPIATLSRGYKQRVGIAQAILGHPKLLILDEPTNGLDPTQTEHMRQLIRELAATATVILSTHIMQEVAALCDRVLIVRGGKLVVDARLDELRHSNFVLLSTSLAQSELTETIKTVAGIADTRKIDWDGQAGHHYRLQLDADTERNSVLSRLAKSIVSTGGELYRLQAEQRDLETLFREVSEAPASAMPTEELSHAA